MEPITVAIIVLGIVVAIIIAAVIIFRRPDVHTPAAIKAIEDRFHERMKGFEDRLHQTALAVPAPAQAPVPAPAPTPAPFPPPVLPYEDWVDAFGPKNGAPIWVIARWNSEHQT